MVGYNSLQDSAFENAIELSAVLIEAVRGHRIRLFFLNRLWLVLSCRYSSLGDGLIGYDGRPGCGRTRDRRGLSLDSGFMCLEVDGHGVTVEGVQTTLLALRRLLF